MSLMVLINKRHNNWWISLKKEGMIKSTQWEVHLISPWWVINIKIIKIKSVRIRVTKIKRLGHTQTIFMNKNLKVRIIQQSQLIVIMVMRNNNMIKCNKTMNWKINNTLISKMKKLVTIKWHLIINKKIRKESLQMSIWKSVKLKIVYLSLIKI